MIQYVYDEASRLRTVDYPTGTDTSLTYDNADRLTQMVDASGTTSWTYNAAYELTRLATPQGQIDYTYDDAGRPHTMAQQGVGTTTYTFDDASRLVSLQNPFSETTSFAYDDASRLVRKTFSSGAYEAYGYDDRNRVTSIALKNSSDVVLALHEYTFDAVSNVLTRTDDGVCTTFGYDEIDQLISESRTGYSASYTYDANGNRASKTLNGVVQTYVNDAGDKLTGIWQGLSQVKAFTYDAVGRRTSMTTSAGTTSYSYDYEDNLTSVTFPNSSTDSYGYNGQSSRISETSSLGSLTLKRSGTGAGGRMLGDGLADFTPGVGERRNTTAINYSGDLANYTTQFNSSQTVTGTLQFDAFGNITGSTGSCNGPFGAGGRAGLETLTDSGLVSYGGKCFDTTTGASLIRNSFGYGTTLSIYGALDGGDAENSAVAFGVGLAGLKQSESFKVSSKGRWLIIDPSKSGDCRRFMIDFGRARGKPPHTHFNARTGMMAKFDHTALPECMDGLGKMSTYNRVMHGAFVVGVAMDLYSVYGAPPDARCARSLEAAFGMGGALLGAALGSLLGPLGTIGGAMIGGYVFGKIGHAIGALMDPDIDEENVHSYDPIWFAKLI